MARFWKRVAEKVLCLSVMVEGVKPLELMRCLKRSSCRARHCRAEEMEAWKEDMEKSGWLSREMSSSALRVLTEDAMEEM